MVRQFLEALISALGTESVAAQPQTAVLAQSKAEEREKQETIVLDLARTKKRDRVLYHYTDRQSVEKILSSQSPKCSEIYKGRLGGGITHPAGAYATDIEPWNPLVTQRQLQEYFFGGNASKDVSWFVAVDGLEFREVWGSKNQWVRGCPAGDFIPVEIIYEGPNLMNP